MNEVELVNRVKELEAENAEYLDIIDKAYDKMKDLELRVNLHNSATGKDAKTKRLKNYESKIAELEELVGSINMYQLSSFEYELINILKELAKLRCEVNEAIGVDKADKGDLDTLDAGLNKVHREALVKLGNILAIHRDVNSMRNHSEFEIELMDTLATMPSLIQYLCWVNSSKQREVDTLKKRVVELEKRL